MSSPPVQRRGQKVGSDLLSPVSFVHDLDIYVVIDLSLRLWRRFTALCDDLGIRCDRAFAAAAPGCFKQPTG